jgi:ATP-dependent Lon protease
MVVLSAKGGTGGMAKKEADDLMAKFLADRKQERLQESQMLADVKSKEVDQAEEVLKTREFYGGNFLESMNPFKQVEDTGDLDTKMQSRVVHTLLQQTQFSYLQAKMKALQVQIKSCPAPNLWYTTCSPVARQRPSCAV